MTRCKDCKDFHVRYQPLKIGRECYDSGLAECKRHGLVVDFTSTQKLNRLTCVEDREGYYKDKAEGRVIE